MHIPVTTDKPAVAQYDPAVHAEQLDDHAMGGRVPARQLEQLVNVVTPELAEKVPEGQLEQLVEPVLAWYVPTAQFVQVLAPAAEYLPATQLPVTAERPVVAQKDPEGQFEQPDCPVLAWNVPIAQAPSTVVSPVIPQKAPDGHDEQLVEPVDAS